MATAPTGSNGKALRVRDTFVLEDTSGNEVAKIQERKLSVRDKIAIEREGRTVATVRKALVGIRDRFAIDVDDGPDLKAKGNIVDHEYEIERDGDTVAHISKKWFRVRDTYGVEIDAGEDEGTRARNGRRAGGADGLALICVAVILQLGTTGPVKVVRMSAKLVDSPPARSPRATTVPRRCANYLRVRLIASFDRAKPMTKDQSGRSALRLRGILEVLHGLHYALHVGGERQDLLRARGRGQVLDPRLQG